MDAQLLLADSAQVAPESGKVYALGLGWTATVTPLPPQAVIILVDVDWDETNVQHEAVVRLVDADGRPVTVSGPDGDHQIEVQARFESRCLLPWRRGWRWLPVGTPGGSASTATTGPAGRRVSSSIPSPRSPGKPAQPA